MSIDNSSLASQQLALQQAIAAQVNATSPQDDINQLLADLGLVNKDMKTCEDQETDSGEVSAAAASVLAGKLADVAKDLAAVQADAKTAPGGVASQFLDNNAEALSAFSMTSFGGQTLASIGAETDPAKAITDVQNFYNGTVGTSHQNDYNNFATLISSIKQ